MSDEKPPERDEHVNVRSTSITSLDYKAATKQVMITFQSGATETVNCDHETFKAFASAPSVGKFYHQTIKGRR